MVQHPREGRGAPREGLRDAPAAGGPGHARRGRGDDRGAGNGKLRDTLTAAKGTPRETLEEMALASQKVVRLLGGTPPRKVIVVPDRLVNLVA